jgi:carbamoyltransferase
MFILGISCFYHDAAAALIEDGNLVAAAEEERFTRKKHDYDFPENAIQFCLRWRGIDPKDLDYVVFYEKPFLKFERILKTNFATYPKSWQVFRESMLLWLTEKLWIKGIIKSKVGVEDSKILFVEHHLSHAASAFFCSPFEEAAIMTTDGVGEWATTTLGVGKGNEINLSKEIRFPHSLGLFYSGFTAFLGFEVNEGEYKVMGMAPYGEPRYLDKVYQLIEVDPSSGGFWLNMDYFSFHHSTKKTFNGKFEKLFGEPRIPESKFVTLRTNPELKSDTAETKRNQYYADVAASVQWVTEETLLSMANYMYKETGLHKLCIAGGVALNSAANGRILRETPFEELFIQPAAGDSGGALGAALYAYYGILGKPRHFVLEHAYWGSEYNESEIKECLDSKGVRYEKILDDEKLTDRVVDSIIKGQVIGWFDGRFEWGPRALGNRSILADPRRADMKGIVNEKIKFREPFRPFAPVVLEKRTEEYFDFPEPEKHYPARFMLLVYPVREEKRSIIPAVTHEGGTGRLQTITPELNPRYYRVIEKFGEATGVNVLLNTSFNLRGEPIVATPVNALNTFSKSGLDLLVLKNFLVRKDTVA